MAGPAGGGLTMPVPPSSSSICMAWRGPAWRLLAAFTIVALHSAISLADPALALVVADPHCRECVCIQGLAVLQHVSQRVRCVVRDNHAQKVRSQLVNGVSWRPVAHVVHLVVSSHVAAGWWLSPVAPQSRRLCNEMASMEATGRPQAKFLGARPKRRTAVIIARGLSRAPPRAARYGGIKIHSSAIQPKNTQTY